MVAAGLGFGFLPANSVRHPGVVGLPIIEPELWRDVNLVSIRGRPHSPPSALSCAKRRGRNGSASKRSACVVLALCRLQPDGRAPRVHEIVNRHALGVVGIDKPSFPVALRVIRRPRHGCSPWYRCGVKRGGS